MIKQLSWRLLILAGVMAAGAGGAAAQTFTCNSTLPAGNYTAVNVPAAATCNVSTSGNVSVSGNVTVGSGATLQDFGTATFTVSSSLLAVGAKMIYLVPQKPGAVNILGSVSVTGATQTVDIRNSFIGGTLSVANSTISAYINFTGNSVGGMCLIETTPRQLRAITTSSAMRSAAALSARAIRRRRRMAACRTLSAEPSGPVQRLVKTATIRMRTPASRRTHDRRVVIVAQEDAGRID